MTIDYASERVKVPKKVRSIAIIGGGPAAAVTLDTLKQQNAFDEITVFERGSHLGGVWNISDSFNEKLPIAPGSDMRTLDPPLENIPRDLEIGQTVEVRRSRQHRFDEGAGYKRLRTNVPQQLMCFSDLKEWGIPDERKIDKDYCYAEDVRDYIRRYFARHSKDHIELNTSVEEVYKDYSFSDSKFVLTLRKNTNDRDTNGGYIDTWYKKEFDALLIATGHYNVPFIPEVDGLDKVFAKYPSKLIHSKYFVPGVDTYDDEVVVVIGSRISAFDIITSLSKTAKFVYNSKKQIPEVQQKNQGFENIQEKPLITSYSLKTSDNGEDEITVHFSDGSTVVNPDRIIYATGYHSSYPFLEKNFPNFSLGHTLPDLYDHTIYTKDPLLAVIGIPTSAITFRVFEYQAIYVSAFLAGKLTLPSIKEQNRWCLERFSKYGNSRLYHAFEAEKFNWTRELIAKSGNYHDGINGRKYPEYTQEDEDLHKEVLKKYAEEVYYFLDPTKMYF
ncbi:hypothetical protein WICMUC_004406 [Wickerhamomyces mucosus]|uniref:Flavin-containing monooxygenase n=1 Tax=Wickerhamomyces mucosus TaxID=1378264 RepID=A0A9P8PJ03_9ASCO|nr:hypothetical protein WICMUC_004406 [Wickerhamomyces mucosus]